MSFIIEKVVLSNFRTHKFLEFTPLTTGVTVIKGANGSGKSSLVDSISWAIYGTKPSGLSKNTDLRKKGMDIDSDQCFAEVTLKTSSGSTYKIQRRIVGGAKGSVKCDVWKVFNEDNGDEVLEHVAGDSVTHANEFILKNLKISEKNFLASMFVQQKEVDELIKSKPADRSAVIESLTGISALTEAQKRIREDVRNEKKTLEVIESNMSTDDSVDMLTENLRALNADNEDMKTQIASVEQEKTKALEKLSSSKVGFSRAKEKEREIELLGQEKDLIVRNIEFVEKELRDSEESEQSTREEIRRINSGNFNPREIVDNYRACRESIDELNNDISQKTAEKESVRRKMLEYMPYRDFMANYGISLTKEDFSLPLAETVKKVSDSLEFFVDEKGKISQSLVSLKEKQELLASQISESMFKVDNYNQTLSALDNEDGKCPTCHQKPDNLNVLLESTKKLRGEEETKLVGMKEDLASTKKDIVEYEKTYRTIVEVENKLSLLKNKYPTFVNLKNDIVEKEENLAALKEKFNSLEEDYANVKTLKNLKDSFDKIKEKKSGYEEKIDALEKDLEEKKAELEKVESEKFTSSDELEKDVRNAEEEVDLIKSNIVDLERKMYENDTNIKYLEKDIARAKNSQNEHTKILDSLSQVTAGLDIVSSYRELLINNVTPEISHVASDLLESFTNGKFVGMELDSNYKTKVILSDGTTRDTGLLSGGELSAVALSLRLAIALISYGNNVGTSTMILDEVLVSQDEDRVENIISTMKEKLQGQVILIGHNGDIISSIADKIVELTPSS